MGGGARGGGAVTPRPGAEDRAAIEELVARYNRAINANDREEFLSVFTDDAVWISPMGGRSQGPEELGAFIDGLFAEERFADLRAGQHWVGNRIYDAVEDDRVETWSSFMFVGPRRDGGVRVALQGSYRDVFVRDPARGWLLAERSVEYIGDERGRWSPPEAAA